MPWKAKLLQIASRNGVYVARAVHYPTGRVVQRSTGTRTRRDAERFLAKWVSDLDATPVVDVLHWHVFRDRFADDHLAHLSRQGAKSYEAAIVVYSRFAKPKTLLDVTPESLSTFRGHLLASGKSRATVASYLRHLRSALSWAKRMGWLASVPDVPPIPGAVGGSMKGFPLRFQQVRQLLRSVEATRPHDAADWRRLIRLLWLSGLRLGEALSLRWDRGPNRVDLAAKPYPTITLGEQKNRRITTTPMPPTLARWLALTPAEARRGLVTPIKIVGGMASHVLSAIGQASPIRFEGRAPTAHDLRRGFGTHWAARVRPLTLQAMMRHASLSTTLKYYVALDDHDVGFDIWQRRHPKRHPNPASARDSRQDEP
jgi:integrase